MVKIMMVNGSMKKLHFGDAVHQLLAFDLRFYIIFFYRNTEDLKLKVKFLHTTPLPLDVRGRKGRGMSADLFFLNLPTVQRPRAGTPRIFLTVSVQKESFLIGQGLLWYEGPGGIPFHFFVFWRWWDTHTHNNRYLWLEGWFVENQLFLRMRIFVDTTGPRLYIVQLTIRPSGS